MYKKMFRSSGFFKREGEGNLSLPSPGIFLVLSIILLAAIVLWPASSTAAQDEPVTWQPPRNLSQSGAAADPQIVLDNAGRLHALWREDAINNFVYTRENEDGTWTRPLPAEFPFATRRYFSEDELHEEEPTPLFDPVLAADITGRIHAFWRNEDDILYYSQVGANQVTNFESWTPPVQVAEAVTAVVVTTDNEGRVHLAYIRPLDTASNPAGIYYQNAFAGSPAWSGPQLLAASTYFRAMPPEDANLQMTLTPGGGVWVGWENPSLEQIFLAGSLNQGQSWEAPLIMDRREESDKSAAKGPAGLRLIAAGDTLHIFWQAGHENENCTQYHRYSPDGGVSWTPVIPMEQFELCPEYVLAAGDSNGSGVMLIGVTADNTAMWAWNGIVWSLQKRQPLHLNNLQDPATFRAYKLDQPHAFLANPNRLILIGMDDNEKQDVWLLERALADTAEWFAPPSIWARAVSIAPAPEIDTFLLLASQEAQDPVFHAFWSSKSDGDLFYARGAGRQWQSGAPLIESAADLAATLDSQNQLLALWNNAAGQLLFSKVDAGRAGAISEWSEPVSLPLPRLGISKQAIVVGPGDAITAAFVLPVNEARGVYVTRSLDNGESWSEPVQVFDAAAEGWPAADSPRLAQTGDDTLHLTWTRTELPDEAAQGLYYARSDDGGETWSAPQPVESQATRTRTAVLWSDLVGVGEQVVHRVWQTAANPNVTVWHQFSIDDGISWSKATVVANDIVETDEAGPATLASDAAGRLFLLTGLPERVRQYVWEGGQWREDESYVLNNATAVTALKAVTNVENELGLMMAVQAEDVEQALMFATGLLAEPEDAPAPVPTLTPIPSPTPTITPTPAPQPTPTVAFPLDREGGWEQTLGLTVPNSTIFQLGSGILPAALVVLLGFFIGLKVVRRKRS